MVNRMPFAGYFRAKIIRAFFRKDLYCFMRGSNFLFLSILLFKVVYLAAADSCHESLNKLDLTKESGR